MVINNNKKMGNTLQKKISMRQLMKSIKYQFLLQEKAANFIKKINNLQELLENAKRQFIKKQGKSERLRLLISQKVQKIINQFCLMKLRF